MEHRALAFEPGSLGGGAINEKLLVSSSVVVIPSLEIFRLWDDPLLHDECDRGSASFWHSSLEPERGSSVSLTVLDEGSSSI